MKQYLQILKEIKEEGKWKENRTGVRTKYIPSAIFKHDMANGFPLLTTKFVSLKNVAVELEGFIQGVTSKKWFEDRSCKIWTSWANPQKVPYANDEETKKKMREEDDLGKIYGYIWNNFEGASDCLVAIEKRTYVGPTQIKYPIFELVEPEKDSSDELVGKIFTNGFGADYVVLRKCPNKQKHNGGRSRILYDIQFLLTGYIKTEIRVDVVKKGCVKDVYHPNKSNSAAMGEHLLSKFEYNKELKDNLIAVWGSMMDRCYNKSCGAYPRYGGAGIEVCADWHIFANFLSDVKHIQGWHDKIREPHEFELDKDYYCSNVYSKDTCVWLRCEQNASYHSSKPFNIIYEDGTKKMYISTTKCGKEHNINKDKITSVLRGERNSYKGYKFEWVNDGKIYRYQLPINQIKNIVETLKTNPLDRRMICTAWNPTAIQFQALPPCHYSWQVVSDGEYLHLSWNQRSNDCPIGNPYNIASYALLLKLLAKESNMKEGVLTGFLSDVHLYEDQQEGVDLQLTREPLELCTVDIPNFTSIFDWTHKDIQVNNYKHHGKIIMPVAV